MGRKGLNVNFTVHKVEQLNLKERTCRRLQDRRNWSVRACVLPPSVSWVHIWQFSCLVWFIAEFLFWWGVHDGFGHIFTDPPPKESCLGTFSQALGSVHRLQGACHEFPLWLSELRTRLVPMRMKIWSLALLSGWMIPCVSVAVTSSHSSDLTAS